MSFLQRQRSVKEKAEKRSSKPLPLIPSPAAVENVAQKSKRMRTTSAMSASLLMRRVSSIFTPRKKPHPDLTLVNQALRRDTRRPSYSSSIDSLASDDDIRIPSGLGSAVSILSNQSLPPSPFHPHPPTEPPPFPDGEYLRTRANSTPNLLRSFSLRLKGKVRRGSIAPTPVHAAESTTKLQSELEGQLPPPPSPPALLHKTSTNLPKEIIYLILSHLPPATVALCAVVSREFTLAASYSLYATLDIDTLSPPRLEKLVTLLVLRRDLTDLVTSFTCRQWPPFFLPNRDQNDIAIGHDIQQKDALLTASFTVALERMSNLISLTLPSFNFSLLSHHSAFGLRSLTFLNDMTSEEETKSLFAWLDGQTNIVSLRFPNLQDSHANKRGQALSIKTNIPKHERIRAKTAPSSPHLEPFPSTSLSPFASPSSSPRSAYFCPPSSSSSARSPPPTPPSPAQFGSQTLLPNLAILHATPSIAMLLASPMETGERRPLKSVSLNINNTLYNGLRPAALMGSFHGIHHLALRFGEEVDRRSYEKVLGAVGAALGAPGKDADANDDDDPFPDALSQKEEWQGLRSLEVSFCVESAVARVGRDEVGVSIYLLLLEFVSDFRTRTFSFFVLYRQFIRVCIVHSRATNRSIHYDCSRHHLFLVLRLRIQNFSYLPILGAGRKRTINHAHRSRFSSTL
ncbi:hypothetical protein M413DRAFT_377484 [Hebeloma cylindrosporum]|uniref:F-box domain-containing protein n=1 Tax=Hebeloma cylindrosporum TaxID=76867 RepID=A0A0C3C5V0_HEBCY|nr:hypothetical protein M413DRAFT_377484 [Hebeloma cylindrosporum h7]